MAPGTALAGFKGQFQVSPELREQVCPHTRVLLSDPKGKLSVEKRFSCFELCSQTSIALSVHLRGCVGQEMDSWTVEQGQVNNQGPFPG